MNKIALANMVQPVNAALLQHSFKSRKNLKGREFGQGMTEYIVIVALIAVAAIGVYQLFGQTVRSQTAAIVNEVGGVTGAASIGEAKAAATAANDQRGKKGLDAYTGAAAATAAK